MALSLKYTVRGSPRISDRCAARIPSVMTGKGLTWTQDQRDDCFTDLPEEIRLSILTRLASSDVVNAKIGSVALANTALGTTF